MRDIWNEISFRVIRAENSKLKFRGKTRVLFQLGTPQKLKYASEIKKLLNYWNGNGMNIGKNVIAEDWKLPVACCSKIITREEL